MKLPESNQMFGKSIGDTPDFLSIIAVYQIDNTFIAWNLKVSAKSIINALGINHFLFGMYVILEPTNSPTSVLFIFLFFSQEIA